MFFICPRKFDPMKKYTVAVIGALFLCVSASAKLEKVVFVPQWTPQSQFAGYYMALEKGYYAEEGLDVVIDHIGLNSTESVQDRLFGGDAQIVGMQLLQAIVARSDGRRLVNVMQLTQSSGLMCVSHTPVAGPADLDGMSVGRWKVGYSDFCEIMQYYNNVSINWVPFINGINLYVFGAVQATLCYSFSEFVALKLAVGDIPEDHIIRFSDFGYKCPEDGIYVTEKYYMAKREIVNAFVRATKRGWDYVRNHRDEAVSLSLRWCRENNIVTNQAMQAMMLDEYLFLQKTPSSGKYDYAPVDKDVFDNVAQALLNVGYITYKPLYEEVIR